MREKKKWMMAAAAAVGAVTGRICYECRHFTMSLQTKYRKLLRASVLLC